MRNPTSVLSPRPFEAFSAEVRPQLEARLADEVEHLGLGFTTLDQSVSLALGVGGPPGRRWRPLMALAAARALGEPLHEGLWRLALAVELTHTASLVLDDLPCMDDDALRRGAPSTHRQVGAAGAVLVAVGFLGRSAELLGHSESPPGMCEAWGSTFGFHGMAGGQVVDLTAGSEARGEDRRLYRRKSTALVAFALWGAGRLTKAGDDTVEALRCFGRDLGWAYQVADDRMDRVEDSSKGRAIVPVGTRDLGRRVMRRAVSRLNGRGGLSSSGSALLVSAAETVTSLSTELAPC